MTDPTPIEELRDSVAELRTAVEGMNENRVDQETVERVALEVLERQRAADEEANRQRRSFEPDDTEAEFMFRGQKLEQKDRMAFLHQRTAKLAARALPARTRITESDVEEFHRAADELTILTAVINHARKERGQPLIHPRETRYFNEEFIPAMRAVDSTTAAEGDEFVPTELSGSLIERLNLSLRVLALIPTIPMPTQPYEVPAFSVSRVRLGLHAESTADTGQTKFKVVTPGTRKVTLDAKKFAGRMLVSREAEEDMIIPVLPWMRQELLDYLAADLEDAALNGDTAGTHQDSDTTAADDPRKNWSGFRKEAQTAQKTDASNAILTVAMLRTNRKKMAKYGISPSELVHIIGISSYVNLLSDANVITVDKYGPQATILSGELGKADGAPLIVSEYSREDLNASGVHDGVTTNRCVAITLSRRGFFGGERRGIQVETLRELYAESDQDLILASTRRALQRRYPTTEGIVALHYNLQK